MNSRNFGIHVPVSGQKLFNYISDIRNLKEWATDFCQDLKKEGSHWKAVTPMGELFVRIEADDKTGVVDMISSPDGKLESVLPTRVLSLPDGSSFYSVTFFQEPVMNDEVFDSQCCSLEKEMGNIKRNLSS